MSQSEVVFCRHSWLVRIQYNQENPPKTRGIQEIKPCCNHLESILWFSSTIPGMLSRHWYLGTLFCRASSTHGLWDLTSLIAMLWQFSAKKRVAMVKPTALVVVRGSRYTLLLWWLIRREKVRLTSWASYHGTFWYPHTFEEWILPSPY